MSVMDWARWNQNAHPELELLHHCPNGGSRNKAEAVKLKQMGVKAGIPDLVSSGSDGNVQRFVH